MNAIVRYTFASLRANRVRTLVTIAGVALAAALLTAVLTTYTSLTHYLYESEAALAGTWTTMVQEQDSEQLQQQIDEARNASDVSALATMQDVGFGQLTEEQQNRFGYYLTIQSVAGDVEEACAIRPCVGRMPERADELMLWVNWRDAANVQLGDTLTLPVGQRRVVALPDAEDQAADQVLSAAEDDHATDYDDEVASDFEDGALLDSRMGYLSAELYDDAYNEELTDAHERTFTVVGFYEQGNYALANSMGTSGITVDDPQATGLMSVYLTITGATDQQELMERTEALFPDANITPHTAMLRFMGISGSGYIWDTFFALATVLAAVIVAACVSLIYNAFAISVAERMSQFGLLSSIGATRRQIRRSVLLEALVVACIGIPLGLLVGIAGCAATFAFIGPMIVSVLGDSGVPFDVHPAVWALVGSSALTLVAVLVSVYVPALRASRKNIIDALRWTSGGQVSKKGKRLAAHNTNPGKLWRRGVGFGRILGAGGMLARIERKRGATKGRAASVSLALAIALLMTAGSLSMFLGYLTDAADLGVDYDIELDLSAREYRMDALGTVGSPETYAALEGIYAAAAEAPGVKGAGWEVMSRMPAVMDESMIGSGLRNGASGQGGFMGDHQYGSEVSTLFLDDETFESYVHELGFDLAHYTDPAHPRAIAVGTVYSNDGERYQREQLLQGSGMMKLYVGGTYRGENIEGFGQEVDYDVAADARTTNFIPMVFDGEKSTRGTGLDDPEASLEVVAVDVAGLASHAPAVVQQGSSLNLIMSRTLLPCFNGATVYGYSRGAYDVVEGTSAQADEAILQAANAQINEVGLESELFAYTNDYAAMQDSNKMLATIVRVFCLLFTVILALIAMTNVFNTVTNSLILRRREFAVMRSIGMSGRQFRRMIAAECARFAVVGLVAGLVVATGVSYLIFLAITQSMEGLTFMLPWNYVALAVGMTVAAMGVSVAYGMHRCKADNVVEALRMENI